MKRLRVDKNKVSKSKTTGMAESMKSGGASIRLTYQKVRGAITMQKLERYSNLERLHDPQNLHLHRMGLMYFQKI